MQFLSYKSFVWPRNPHTYTEKISREPLYMTQDGVTLYNGMSSKRRIVTGSGEFFGEDAYDKFKQLLKLAEEDTPGNLEHPIWGIRYCYFTKLELTQEPKENYVKYQFEFTQALANGTIPR